ncbi:MAG TPA: response regulator [Anaerolineae bacterium]|nr:response regulator [Anaerolineae bacterium]
MRLAWIIDDDDEMLHAIELMLQILGFKVETFREARHAVNQLQEGKRPNVIVLDVMMPDVSGMDMLEFLRLHEDLYSIPVVMLSTESADVQVDEALQKGADGYVFKPVSIEELEREIKKAMQPRKQKDRKKSRRFKR